MAVLQQPLVVLQRQLVNPVLDIPNVLINALEVRAAPSVEPIFQLLDEHLRRRNHSVRVG